MQDSSRRACYSLHRDVLIISDVDDRTELGSDGERYLQMCQVCANLYRATRLALKCQVTTCDQLYSQLVYSAREKKRVNYCAQYASELGTRPEVEYKVEPAPGALRFLKTITRGEEYLDEGLQEGSRGGCVVAGEDHTRLPAPSGSPEPGDARAETAAPKRAAQLVIIRAGD